MENEKENVFTHPTVIHNLRSKLTSSRKFEKLSDIFELALQVYFIQTFKKGTFNVAAMQKGVSDKAVEAKANDNSCKLSKIQQWKMVKHVFFSSSALTLIVILT